jgi:co-chaperonin GroES (HSP10)
MPNEEPQVETPTDPHDTPFPLHEHVKLTGGNILVQPELPQEVTEQGIHIPTMANRPARVSVIKATPSYFNTHLNKRVIHSEFVGTPWTINGQVYYMLNASEEDGSFGGEVLGIISEEVVIDKLK